MADREYKILKRVRPDGVACFFLKSNGRTIFSSYDEGDIKDFALGYTGKVIAIENEQTA